MTQIDQNVDRAYVPPAAPRLDGPRLGEGDRARSAARRRKLIDQSGTSLPVAAFQSNI